MKEIIAVLGLTAGGILLLLLLALVSATIYTIPIYFLYKWFLIGIGFPRLSFWTMVAMVAILKIIFLPLKKTKDTE